MNLTRLKTLALDKVPRSVILTDDKGKIVYVNQQVLNLFDLTQEQCLGQNLRQFIHRSRSVRFHPDQPPLSHANADSSTEEKPQRKNCVLLEAIKTGKQITNFSDTFKIQDKQLPVEFSLYPLTRSIADSDQEVVVGFMLRFRKETQAARQNHRFIAALGHEIKTPLTIIKSYTHLIKSELEKDTQKMGKKSSGKLNDYLSVIDGKVGLMTRLTKRMIDTIKLGSGKLKFNNQVVEFEVEITNIVSQLQKTIRTHHLQLEGEATSQIYVDRQRLFQVISNLINNAVKYSPEAEKVEIVLTEKDQSVQVQIQDHGSGITEEDQPKIFEPFFRSKLAKEYPGIGIGLFFAKRIVDHYQGEIWFETQPNSGSSFFVKLPKYRQGKLCQINSPQEF